MQSARKNSPVYKTIPCLLGLLVFTLALCLKVQAGVSAPSSITVVSYNIGKGGTVKLPRGRNELFSGRLTKLASRLQRMRHVVVSLQEVDRCTKRTFGARQVRFLLAKLPGRMNGYYLPKRFIAGAPGCSTSSTGIAILTDGKVLKIVAPLSIYNNRAGPVLAAKIQMSGKVFWFLSIHLSTQRFKAIDDIVKIKNWIVRNVKKETPVILAGDFNILKYGCHEKRGCTGREKSVYQQMVKNLKIAGLSDVSGEMLTFKPWNPLSHIDYIFVQHCFRRSLSKLFSNGRGVSDHVGLVARLSC